MPRQYRGKKYRAASKLQALFRGRRARKKTTAAKLKKLARKVNQDIEHRWADNSNFNFQIPSAGGDVIDLGTELIATTPTVPNGTDDRLGKKITLKKLYVKGQITVADSRNMCRILLVKATSLNQIIIASDILQGNSVNNQPSIYSPYKKESRIKFKVLFDKIYKLQEQAAGSVYPKLLNVDFSWKFKSGMTITYNVDTNSYPIYQDIKIVCISDSTQVAHPRFAGFKRLSWIA